MLRKLYNQIVALTAISIVPAYRVTYAPEDSSKPELPIQTYLIAGNPKDLAFRSKAGNRLFTALLPRKNEFASFRADRTLSVNFAGWRILTPKQTASYRKSLATASSLRVLRPA